MKKLKIGVVGVGFGASFADIYSYHPLVEEVVVCDLDETRLQGFRKQRQGNKKITYCSSLEEMLDDTTVDAVQICTGIPAHAKQSVAVLESGKHCACAVPMAISIDEIRRVVTAARESRKNYMMMETNLFCAEFLTAKEMLENGEFGKVQYMRGVHYQPMDDGYWGDIRYWRGLPPMYYSTHCIGPLYGIAKSKIKQVVGVGSGTMAKELCENYGNPFPIEAALLSFENGLKGEVARGLFECSAKPVEAFNIYGSKKTLMAEYTSEVVEKVRDEACYDCAGFVVEHRKWKNQYMALPKEIRRFTIQVPEGADNWEEYLETAPFSVHGGSHPHLCHEFVMSIAENRKAAVDEDAAANITAAGICAHTSAMQGGIPMEIPVF